MSKLNYKEELEKELMARRYVQRNLSILDMGGLIWGGDEVLMASY